MLRRVFLFTAVLVLVAGVPAPAGARANARTGAAVALTGEVTCGLNGMLTMNPPLPNTALAGSPKPTKVEITANLGPCSRAGVTGGTLTVTGSLGAGASCYDLAGGYAPDFTFEPNKLEVKWLGTAAGKKNATLGKSKTSVFSTGDSIFAGFEYWTDTFGDADAFAGASATVDLLVENTFDVFACTTGRAGKNLGSVSFSAARGSQISVYP
jgi:hypothetical protein